MSAPWRLCSLVLLAGCAGANAGQSDPKSCGPVSAAAEVETGGLEGPYSVRLVATSGAKSGSEVTGRLELMTQDSANRHMTRSDGMQDTTVTLPFYGTAEMDFAAVGAVVPGDPMSTDPASPGVLVIDSPKRVVLRVGSEANRRDVRRFDGAYTALHIQQVTDGGFAGTWQSGVGTEQSGGHFCADRTT
jgi:hypothetical protein